MSNAQIDRIDSLQQELATLKRQREAEKTIARAQKVWVKTKHLLPTDHQRIIVWCGDRMELCWFSEGSWYVYNGSWWLQDEDKIDGVTHWMPTDWMGSDWFPLYGPGLKNWLKYQWGKLAGQVEQRCPKFMKPSVRKAQLDKKIVYWVNRSGEIRMGLPERYPASHGFQKVVCGNTAEAEAWSDRLRQQNNSLERAKDEERQRFEDPIRSEIKNRMREVMRNSRNQLNHDFVARYLEKMDRDKTRMEREEYLHSEGYEHGH